MVLASTIVTNVTDNEVSMWIAFLLLFSRRILDLVSRQYADFLLPLALSSALVSPEVIELELRDDAPIEDSAPIVDINLYQGEADAVESTIIKVSACDHRVGLSSFFRVITESIYCMSIITELCKMSRGLPDGNSTDREIGACIAVC